MRYGNPGFRLWHEKMKAIGPNLLKGIWPEKHHEAIVELLPYLHDSFGNPTRLDYGTGHELSFILFLMGLFKIGVLEKSDELNVAIKVFDGYLCFVRRLQVTYRLEPAGSQGVWALDDYQFVPFIWGSAQMIGNLFIQPQHLVELDVIASNYRKYMIFSCMDFILQVKSGHIAEHSNQLWGISAVPSWSKICSGLIKMYEKEVLGKFPVIQHVLFGSIFTLTPVKPGTVLPKVDLIRH